MIFGGIGALIMLAPLMACGGFCAVGMIANRNNLQRFEPQKQEPEKVTRANFNMVHQDMRVSQVEAILGPRRDDLQADIMANCSWRSRDGRCTISATFESMEPEPWLVGKTIIGD